MSKPTKNEKSASRHPAKVPPPRKPQVGDEGFGDGHVYRQHLKNSERRDQLDPTKRGKP